MSQHGKHIATPIKVKSKNDYTPGLLSCSGGSDVYPDSYVGVAVLPSPLSVSSDHPSKRHHYTQNRLMRFIIRDPRAADAGSHAPLRCLNAFTRVVGHVPSQGDRLNSLASYIPSRATDFSACAAPRGV